MKHTPFTPEEAERLRAAGFIFQHAEKQPEKAVTTWVNKNPLPTVKGTPKQRANAVMAYYGEGRSATASLIACGFAGNQTLAVKEVYSGIKGPIYERAKAKDFRGGTSFICAFYGLPTFADCREELMKKEDRHKITESFIKEFSTWLEKHEVPKQEFGYFMGKTCSYVTGILSRKRDCLTQPTIDNIRAAMKRWMKKTR